MKRVPAEEFARHAAEYLEGTEPVSIEKDGEVIGRYVPTPNGHAGNRAGSNGRASDEALLRELEKGIDPESLALIRRLDRRFQEIYERAGLTEEEFANLYSPEKPRAQDIERDP
jgi:hypothetical protein